MRAEESDVSAELVISSGHTIEMLHARKMRGSQSLVALVLHGVEIGIEVAWT